MASALWASIAGCAALQPQASVKAPEHVSVKYLLPTLTAVGSGTETQDRGGIVVQLAPMPFQAVRNLVKSCRQQPARLVLNKQYPYEVRETPAYAVPQTNLIFKVKVTNHTDQVLKLEGSILKLNVSDQEVALDQAAYKDLTNAILTPGQEKEAPIQGPEWRALPKDATVHFALYGVPTATDPAGNVTKRENFEWTFTFKAEDKTEESDVPVNVVYMTHEEAAQCAR